MSAYDYLIYLLSRKEYSLNQLRQKLKSKNYPDNEAEQALQIVVEKKYQSDARYAESFVHDQALAGFGPLTIANKLRINGIRDHLIEQTLDEAQFDWFKQAFNYFIRKDYDQLELQDAKVKAKMQRHMFSKGYNFEHISFCLTTLQELKEMEVDPQTFILNDFSYEN
ncbi:hypothetical protein CKF54_06160 [Psittacicella hinzii]|uniref:Regulatory protein RecX n=1 Tax=Psittacicella hinzii TaxID=2028575 RepID=A0A3A1Y2E4_9GAMM|nr:regulatory protein RecX [Psittacicella hinzii]RIY31735.1 hypothetical protein CKF54_06160 [Psittacicella hinzii]